MASAASVFCFFVALVRRLVAAGVLPVREGGRGARLSAPLEVSAAKPERCNWIRVERPTWPFSAATCRRASAPSKNHVVFAGRMMRGGLVARRNGPVARSTTPPTASFRLSPIAVSWRLPLKCERSADSHVRESKICFSEPSSPNHANARAQRSALVRLRWQED